MLMDNILVWVCTIKRAGPWSPCCHLTKKPVIPLTGASSVPMNQWKNAESLSCHGLIRKTHSRPFLFCSAPQVPTSHHAALRGEWLLFARNELPERHVQPASAGRSTGAARARLPALRACAYAGRKISR